MVECFWCDTFYDESVVQKCPNCMSGVNNPVREWTDDFGNKLVNVHAEGECKNATACPIHSPSQNSMRDYSQHWRYDRSFMERICVHGVGHPDPDDTGADPVHGCDGCCSNEAP